MVLPGAVILALVLLTISPLWEVMQPIPLVQVRPAVALAQDAAPRGMAATLPSGRTVQAPGWLEPDPYYIAAAALADGTVQAIHALEGEQVVAGAVVAELVPDDAQLALTLAQAQMHDAQARLQAAQVRQRSAQRDWDHPVERRRAVETTAAQLAQAQGELAQQPAMVEQETALLERWRQELARLQVAHEQGAANERERLILQQQVEAQAAAVKVMQQRQPVLTAKVRQLEAELAAARENAQLRIDERRALDLATAELAQANAQVERAGAELAIAQLRRQRMTITAPITGYVMRRLKAPGDKVMLGMDDPHSAHLLHLYDPARMQVRVDVPLADAALVRVGQTCQVIVEVLPERVFQGEVTRITHAADLQKNTLQVKVRVVDPDPALRPEMLTRVKFLVTQAPAAGAAAAALTGAPWRIDRRCLHDGQVWAVRQRRGVQGQVIPLPVEPGTVEGDLLQVRGELRPGELLVLDPAGLQPHQSVRMQWNASAEGQS